MAVAAILATGASAWGQSPSLRGVAHVAVRVSDVQRSRDFFAKLGFEQPFAAEKDGNVTEAFIKVNDRQYIELYPGSQGHPSGFLHVCFEGEDLDKLHDFYVAQGLTPTQVRKAGAGNLLFTMEGPEKQNIEYTQYMPGSRHMLDSGKDLGPQRVAKEILGAEIGFKDVGSAAVFYGQKMEFGRQGPGSDQFALPGASGQEIVLGPLPADNHATILFKVENEKATAARLKSLGLKATRNGRELSVSDPDGNVLVFTTQ